MKILLTICSLFYFLTGNCQRLEKLRTFKFENDKIYLFYRGTNSKRTLIAQDFNISSSPATHIGLGLLVDNIPIVYNVSSDIIKNGSALITDSPSSFFSYSSDLYYGAIFSRKISISQKRMLIYELGLQMKRKIVFDKGFKLANNDTLYCSEFVINIIAKTYHAIHLPVTIELKSYIYKKYFDASFLIYYPVDYFVNDKNFKKKVDFFLNQ